MSLEFPGKLRFLFKPARVKGCYGGRGSGKSWGFARALLVIGAGKRIRVLCAREVQKSIQQSVHQLLADQVASLGLQNFYEVLNTEIRGKNGTEFYFAGLSNETAESLKSFEGVTHCWVEEASNISKRSWEILIPTIRAEGSEIWLTFNPQLESDETYQRFVVNPPPDCVMVKMNYNDNPYFPKVLEGERAHAEATMKLDDYRHIWLGATKPAVEGAIYFDAMSQSIAAGRIRDVPHDGSIKTHVVFDLGWNDAMTLILAQKIGSEIRVIHYIEGNQRTLADYSAELKSLRLDDQPMNWGTLFLPHDGFHTRHQSGKDDATILRGFGWDVSQVPNTSVISGIDRAREIFPRVYFHKDRAAQLIECLKRYRWNISQKTGEAMQPLHDSFSHGADAFRYLSLIEGDMTNEEWGGKLNYPSMGMTA
jgi:phage terminase large subunit